jgi:hypothetical protein
MLSEALVVTLQVTRVLDELGVPWVIGGSFASIIHGPIRTTMDVDIVAELQLAHVTPFIATLQGPFYVDATSMQQAIERQSSFNLIHLTTMFKVDIFVPKARAFDQQQLTRRISETIEPGSDERLWVLSAEDIVLSKLDWFHLGGEQSERQWRDVIGVLKTQAQTIDVDYMRQWADQLGVADLLERALPGAEIH